MIPLNCGVANADMTGCLKTYLTKTKLRSLISWGTTQSLALSFMSSSIGFSTLRYQDIYLAHRIQRPIMKLLIQLNLNVLYQLEQVYKTHLFISISSICSKNSGKHPSLVTRGRLPGVLQASFEQFPGHLKTYMYHKVASFNVRY